MSVIFLLGHLSVPFTLAFKSQVWRSLQYFLRISLDFFRNENNEVSPLNAGVLLQWDCCPRP